MMVGSQPAIIHRRELEVQDFCEVLDLDDLDQGWKSLPLEAYAKVSAFQLCLISMYRHFLSCACSSLCMYAADLGRASLSFALLTIVSVSEYHRSIGIHPSCSCMLFLLSSLLLLLLLSLFYFPISTVCSFISAEN